MPKPRITVAALAAGIFTIVTVEILPIGLLPSIAADFGVGEGTAGLAMTMPGLVAAVAAPVVTVATRRFERRAMLVALLSLLGVACGVAVVATSFWALLGSRLLVGVTIGGFWSIGTGLAPRLVRDGGRATAVIFAGVPAGSVLGVPLATMLGEAAGWRTSVALLGALSGAVAVVIALASPRLPAETPTSAAVLVRALRRSPVPLAVTVLVVLAHFGAYTYVTPLLKAEGAAAGPLLLVYGAAGIAGNFAAGALGHRPGVFAGAAASIGLAALALPHVPPVAALVVWGFAYGAVPACSQHLFAARAPGEAATVLFTASFQATMGAAAALGGLLVDAAGPAAVMTAAAPLALAAAMLAGRAGLGPRGQSGGVPLVRTVKREPPVKAVKATGG
ncbi:MFS transporter [Actinorhabdospora filicis]|uniref:MFS transporter n=1 Tax=Actinorhabdospora filicis TaxID=1785913 RepID=A0A9W6SQX5_9ACTN|nr:MFS transporter [Actinorhabdospora filicis]GLZ80364.1 MFS transporter [Actinorhabdospora filicis]